MTTSYILSDPRKLGGVQTWAEISAPLLSAKIIYSINEIDINVVYKIYVNNYINSDLYDKISYDFFNDKLYFVFHSDLCPINKYFLDYINYFSGVICTNKYLFEKIKRLFKLTNIIYLPNFICCDSIIKTEYKFNPNINSKINMKFIGRLSPEKNLPMLFDAISKIPNILLSLYGSGDNFYCEYLKYLCDKLNISDRVLFLGKSINKNQMYQNTDIIILPSIHEGLPYCLLEAESYGIIIITHNISGIDMHIKNIIQYEYTGINKDELNNIIYVDSYKYLLKMIGYTEILITPNLLYKLHPKVIMSLSKNRKINIGKHILIPSHNEIYKINTKKIIDAINDGISKLS